MGYNFLRGAVSEVSGSLKMIGGLSRETGQVMVDWNRRSEAAANAVGLAYQRYATVVQESSARNIAATEGITAAQRNLELVTDRASINGMLARNRVIEAELRYGKTVAASNKLIIEAAQDQAIAFNRVEAAHLKVAESAYLQAQAESDLALIASRAYTLESDRADLNAAANDRLATALGMRAIAEQTAASEALLLANADTRSAAVIAEVATVTELASNKIAIAYEKEALVANQSADAMIVASRKIEGAQSLQTATMEAGAAAQIAAINTVNAALIEQVAVARAGVVAIAGSIQQASAMAMGLGAAFLIGGGIVAAALLFAAGKAGDFQSKLYLLHTQARVPLFITVKENGITKTVDQMELLRKGILSMAGDTGFSANKLADAMYLIESQGAGATTAAHALDILHAAAMGAAVGHSDLIQTSRALAAVMQVFPTIIGGPIGAMGALDAIVGQGMMTMEDLNAALRTGILATLKSSHVGLADFGGALATMTDYAIPATQAANSLRMAIYLMTAPTGASDKVLKEFGLTTAQVSSVSQDWTNKLEKAGIRHAQLADDLRKPGGIIIAMQDLHKHLTAAGLNAEGQAEVIYKAFGGGKMGKAIITLYENIQTGTRASNAELRKLGFTTEEINTLNDRLIAKTAAVNAQAKLLGTNFKFIQDHDPAQMWKDFTSALNAAGLALGYAFIPMLVSILGFLTPIVKGFTDWIEHNQDLAAGIGGGAVALMLIFGTALLVLGALGMVAGAILAIGAVGLPALGVVGLVFAGLVVAAGLLTGAILFIHSIWGSLSDLWERRVVPAGTRLWNTLKSIWDIISSGLKIVKPLFDTAFGDFADTLTEHGGLWDNATQGFSDFSRAIVAWIKSPAFATLVADFAVGLPVAIGIALDAILLFADGIQGAFTLAIGLGLTTWYTMTGQFWKIPGVAKSTGDAMSKIIDRTTKDQLKSASDFSKMYDGTYQNMWQQVYNNTMDMTSKIGNDGSINMQTAGQKMEAADLKAGIHRKKAAYRTFYDVGQAMTDGIADGLLNKGAVGGMFAAIDKLMVDAAAAAKKKNKSKSPSVLWADEVGKPIPQGIWMGVLSEIPTLQRNISGMLTNLLGPRTSTGSVSKAIVASATPAGSAANQVAPTKPISTKRMEELLEKATSLLQQIANEESSINAFAAQRRNG